MATVSEQPRENGALGRLRQPRWHWSIALLLASFYVVSSLYISANRLFWFDEILTALVSRLPSVPTIWKALSEIEDQTPPLYFLITRASDQIFQHADIGLRVPSALALGVGLLVSFDIARRLTDGVYGLIAMSFLATPFVAYYGHEARSYALYLMLASIALWLWLFTKAEDRMTAAALGAVFLIGMGIHYYFFLCLAPFGIAALWERRIFQPKLIAATAGAMCSLAALSPMIARSHSFAKSVSIVWAPSLSRLVAAYVDFLPNAFLPLLVLAIGVAAFGVSRHRPAPSMSAGERVCWFFVVAPLLAYLLGHLVTRLFHERYIIGAAPGMVVGGTCLLWRHYGQSRHLSLALLLAFGGSAIGQQARTLRSIGHIQSESGDYQERTRQTLALENMLLREGKQHVVFSWDIQYLETWYYSNNRHLYECITSEQRWGIKSYVPLKFVSVEDIVADAGHTAVVDPSPALTEALARAGVRLKIRQPGPRQVVYLE